MKVNVDFSELLKLSHEMQRAASLTPQNTTQAVGRVMTWLRTTAVSSAPRRTGALAGSVVGQPLSGGWAARVSSPLRQGFYQEVGTSFHPPQPWLWTHTAQAQAMLEAELVKIGWNPRG